MRAAVGEDVPAGLVLITVGVDGGLSARTGPSRPVIMDGRVQLDTVLDRARQVYRAVGVDPGSEEE